MLDVVTGKRYWFLGCILIYYVLIYPIKCYGQYLNWIFYGCALLVLLVFFMMFDVWDKGLIYNASRYFFKWKYLFMLPFCMICWYAILYVYGNSPVQILSVIPLFGVTYYAYRIASAMFFVKLYQTRWGGNILFIMGGLCLEVYLIQPYLFTDALNFLFPLNIPIVMLVVFVAAYGVRFLSEWIAQTFKSEPYDWGKMCLYKRF